MGSQPPMMPPIGKQGEPPPEPGLGSLGAMPPLSSVNTQGMGKLQPIVTNPRQQQEQDLQSKISGYENQAKPQGFWQNLRHGLAKTAEIAGSIYAPEVVAQIPGTRLHEQQQQRQLAGLQNQDVTMQDAASKRGLEAAQAANFSEEAAEMPGKTASEEALQSAQTYRALHPLATSDFELWHQQNPNGTAQEYQQVLAKPLTQQDADSRNAIWDKIADQYHLPKGQFKAGMPSADAAQLAGSLNNVISRGQGGQSITIKQEAAGKVGDARADRSFQYNQGELDKLTNPISQMTMRMGRLQDTINQNSPQADALMAPELLTIMAGGQGSGLRMNEAEISRIVGGRSNWQSLQASVNKWQTDPSKANSITPSQRQQIRSLVQSVSQKLNVKQEALSQAAGELIDSDDPKQHRAIVQRARTILNSIDEGTQGGGNQSAPGASPQRPAGVPSGYNWNPQGNGGKGSWQPPKQ
jgi:hypothetical protein